jgi:uncharacterized membrane-anchored protein YitT (DUF2179 family)
VCFVAHQGPYRALPDESIDVKAPGSLRIDPALKKQSQIVAVGYAVLCAYYITILMITLAKVPWASFNQIANDLSSHSDSIVALAGFAVVNAVLAICALKILSMHRTAFWCVVLAGLMAVVCFLSVVVLSVVAWRSPEAGTVGWWTISISSIQLIIYSLCAFLLWRVGIVTRRQRKEARMLAMGPLRTTTL